MIALLIAAGSVFCSVADEASFIRHYDSGRYAEAARDLEGLECDSAGVVRRIGSMYYNGWGVPKNQDWGRSCWERAAAKGDACAAMNLAKVYYYVEKDLAKASRSLLFAMNVGDPDLEKDIVESRDRLGAKFWLGLETFLTNLEQQAACEIARLQSKVSALESEASRMQGSSSAQNKMVAEKDRIIQDLKVEIAAQQLAARHKDSRIKEIEESLRVANLRVSELKTRASQLDTVDGTVCLRGEAAGALAKELKTKALELQLERDNLKRTADDAVLERDAWSQKYERLVKRYNRLLSNHRSLAQDYKALGGTIIYKLDSGD